MKENTMFLKSSNTFLFPVEHNERMKLKQLTVSWKISYFDFDGSNT